MNKRLWLLSSVLAAASILLSIPLHLHWSSALEESKDSQFTLSSSEEAIKWQELLSNVAQFKPEPKVDESAVLSTELAKEKEISILDGQLVGIVVDKPASALIFPAGTRSIAPLQLSKGEGWLDGWHIQSIQSDRVIWSSDDNQHTVTQELFQLSNSKR